MSKNLENILKNGWWILAQVILWLLNTVQQVYSTHLKDTILFLLMSQSGMDRAITLSEKGVIINSFPNDSF